MRVVAAFALLLPFTLSSMGCSNNSTLSHDTSGLGAAPTAPPGGNPYAAGTAGGEALTQKAQQDFVDKLAAMPKDQRAAFIRANGTTMTAIQSGPDSPLKQKFNDTINQH